MNRCFQMWSPDNVRTRRIEASTHAGVLFSVSLWKVDTAAVWWCPGSLSEPADRNRETDLRPGWNLGWSMCRNMANSLLRSVVYSFWDIKCSCATFCLVPVVFVVSTEEADHITFQTFSRKRLCRAHVWVKRWSQTHLKNFIYTL